jgi:hypothetical protein
MTRNLSPSDFLKGGYLWALQGIFQYQVGRKNSRYKDFSKKIL